MAAELKLGAMNTFALLAGQLDLAARLERDRRTLTLQGDDAAFFIVGFITVAFDQLPQHGFNAIGAGEGQGATVANADQDLFVFGPDAPLIARFSPTLKVVDEVLLMINQVAHRAHPIPRKLQSCPR